MKIVLIGYGNVGWHLSRFLKLYFDQLEIVTNNPIDTDNFTFRTDIPHDADIYIITRQERFVAETSKNINAENAIVVHTSGTLTANVLDNHKHYGVLYPLQTFRKRKPLSITNINFAIESSDKYTLDTLKFICESIHQNYVIVESEQRLALHTTGVLISNFPNFLYVLAYNLLDKYNLSYEIIKPLIRETTDRLEQYHPSEVQTGPAVRGDSEIIKKHLDFLQNLSTDAVEIYEILSKAIIKYYNK
ncbi:MAG: hypothetical protein PWP68_1575 [Rikenellaceae bacterium]|nr:hypothetical protein [Rikenellaceae bacterium]MDI3546158.1 hypothetical protein [Rikenellaceae bacterium]